MQQEVETSLAGSVYLQCYELAAPVSHTPDAIVVPSGRLPPNLISDWYRWDAQAGVHVSVVCPTCTFQVATAIWLCFLSKYLPRRAAGLLPIPAARIRIFPRAAARAAAAIAIFVLPEVNLGAAVPFKMQRSDLLCVVLLWSQVLTSVSPLQVQAGHCHI